MTRADLQARLTEFEGRLVTQIAERDKVQVMLERMHVAIYQLQGAITVLRDLLADGAAAPSSGESNE